MYYISTLSPPFQGGVSCPKGHDGVVDLPFHTAPAESELFIHLNIDINIK